VVLASDSAAGVGSGSWCIESVRMKLRESSLASRVAALAGHAGRSTACGLVGCGQKGPLNLPAPADAPPPARRLPDDPDFPCPAPPSWPAVPS
jgi:predicted small lipoprotein YifL